MSRRAITTLSSLRPTLQANVGAARWSSTAPTRAEGNPRSIKDSTSAIDCECSSAKEGDVGRVKLMVRQDEPTCTSCSPSTQESEECYRRRGRHQHPLQHSSTQHRAFQAVSLVQLLRSGFNDWLFSIILICSESVADVRHRLNCLVQNEPGVLSRVSGILAGRGFNIGTSSCGVQSLAQKLILDSLVVCQTEIRDLSRMCIILKGQDGVIEQARRQLEDLVS